MLRPKLPPPVVYTPAPVAPAAPAVHQAPVPACSCQHTPAPVAAPAPTPVVVQAPAANRPPLGLYLAGGTVAVAGVVALAVAVTALFLAIAVTAMYVPVFFGPGVTAAGGPTE